MHVIPRGKKGQMTNNSMLQCWWKNVVRGEVYGSVYVTGMHMTIWERKCELTQKLSTKFLRDISSPTQILSWELRGLKKLDIVITVVTVESKSHPTLQPYGLQHARLPYPSLSPRAFLNSYSLCWWCHPTIPTSVAPISSYYQSFQNQGLFQWVGSSHQVAKVLELQLQHQSFQWIFRMNFRMN